MNLVDSGVAWLGAIPEDWAVKPAKALFRSPSEPSLPIDVHLTPSQKYGVLPQSEYMELTGSRVVLNLTGADNMKHVAAGDFVSHLRSFQGGLEFSTLDGKVSNAYTVLRPRTEIVHGYYRWLFKSSLYIQGLQTTTDQLRDGQSIRYGQFALLPLPQPALNQQRAISDFLDRETAQIDTLIAKQEQLIATLGERRKALIANATSRGLVADVPTKETGISQLGSIPSHWVAQRLRNIAQLNSGADYKDIEVEDGGFPVYGSGGIFTNASRFMFEGESVLFGRKGTIDKPLYVNGAFWTVDTMYWTRFIPGVNVKFVSYWAQTLPFALFTTSTALPSMTSSDIKNFYIALPPLEEQNKIVAFLDDRTGVIDALETKTVFGIGLLKERRQALISGAVTGKIDVRE